MDLPPPSGEAIPQCSQKAWDHPRAAALADQLLDNAYDEEDTACLLAASWESGVWLNAGWMMIHSVLLWASACTPHSCRHCNDLVNPLCRHGLMQLQVE